MLNAPSASAGAVRLECSREDSSCGPPIENRRYSRLKNLRYGSRPARPVHRSQRLLSRMQCDHEPGDGSAGASPYRAHPSQGMRKNESGLP